MSDVEQWPTRYDALIEALRAIERQPSFQDSLDAGQAADCISACRPFLKEHETLADCIARNRADVTMVLGMLAKDRTALEEARAQLKAAQAYLDELTAHDNAFPANPLEISQWTRKGVDLIARANKVFS